MGELIAPEGRVPWWKWTLLSVGSSLFLVAATIAGVIALAYRGVFVPDYVLLSRPPYVRDGATAFLLALLIAGQTLVPVLALLVFRPGRVLVWAGLRLPADLRGTSLRLAAGAVLALLLQIVWARLGPVPAEHWRTVEHLVYAVTHGGPVWPAVWLALAIGLVGPAAEEVMFRGFLLTLLRRRWGYWAGALVTAALFGLAHGPAGAVPTGLLGLYFAYQAEKDGSLLGATALHVLNNVGALIAIRAGL